MNKETEVEALIADMKAAAELIADGYRRNWVVSHDSETCWIGANDDDGQLTPFIEVSIGDWSGCRTDNTRLADFIALIRPANVLALIAALEQAQAQSSKWLEAYHKAVSIGARYEERIAELEARPLSVKLPPRAPENLGCVLDGYEKWLVATTFRDTWNACLSEVSRMNAGGTVEDN